MWKKEYQKRGAFHWDILFWVKPDTTPDWVVLAEVPRLLDIQDKDLQNVGIYLRKIVLKMQHHRRCFLNWCFKGSFGKHLPQCKYGFPLKIPQEAEELDEECIRYLHVRKQHKDRLVVPYNPEIAILWGLFTKSSV